MKKIKQILILAILAVTFASCGTSVKVTDAWKADNINELEGAKILVIGRADDMTSRQRFEQEISERLRADGIDATESYKKFPSMKQNVKRTEEEVDQLIQIIKNEGFKGVVLTVLKDMSTEIVTSETGGYTAGGYYGGGYGMHGMGYGGHYGGFGGYYGSVYSPYGYGYGGSYVPSETRTYTSKIYVLETVIYNLELEKGKQLMSVISVEVTDPKSASEVAPKYADKVLKAMKNKT
ncbi:MAG: hypothetical protein KAH67_06690 [Flavobacteriaceae bacterium]|nr:hypothetical protein [Flavobacteriaceae bacterium]